MEKRVVQKLFPGPADWFHTDILKALKNFGMPRNFPDAQAIAHVAKVRVALHEARCSGGLRIAARAASLRAVIADLDNVQRLGSRLAWASSNFLFSLDAALRKFTGMGAKTAELLDTSSEEGRPDGWQARALTATQPSFVAASLTAMRRSLDKWQIPALPGHRCLRLQRSLQVIATLMPPRVLAAVLRANLNGWMTARRFQQQGRCLLGCQRLEDSVTHYGRCACYHSLCGRFLDLARPPAGHELEEFLLLGGESTTEGRGHAKALRALSVYALYRTHNAVRCAGSSGPCADLFRGYLREGVRGHAKASSLLQVAFKRLHP